METNTTPKTLTVDRAIEVLNEALSLDAEAMRNLVLSRVECNDALAKHPTIGVVTEHGRPFRVGLLGVLNGMFGFRDGEPGSICAVLNAICPEGHELPDYLPTGTPCPTCGAVVELGQLLGFQRLPDDAK